MINYFISDSNPLAHYYIVTNYSLAMNYDAAKMLNDESPSNPYMRANVDTKGNFAQLCKNNMHYSQ